MRSWAILFLVIALILAFFGFTVIPATAAGMVKILSFLFIAGFFVILLIGLIRRKRPPPDA